MIKLFYLIFLLVVNFGFRLVGLFFLWIFSFLNIKNKYHLEYIKNNNNYKRI